VIAATAVLALDSQAGIEECGFIDPKCCCTNACCFEAGPGEVRQIGEDSYLIVPSGQVVQRTGFSPDGRYIRCACDLIDGKWTVTPTAHTRCLYVPLPMM